MNRLRDHPWIVLVVGVALLGGYVLVRAGGPRVRAVARDVATWHAERARIDAAARWEEDKAGLLALRRRLETRLAALHDRSPTHDQTSVILRQLQRHADSTGVVLRQIRPGKAMRFSTHDEHTLSLTLDGRFHEITAFVDRIERTGFVHVHRLDLRSDDLLAPILDADLDLRRIRLHTSPPAQRTAP